LRKCNVMPDKLCLYYHIGQCLGPCVFNVSDEQNQEMIDGITNFLNGETDGVMKELEDKMHAAAKELEFEKAKEYRDLMGHIENTMLKQNMLTSDMTARDCFGYAVDNGWMSVSVLFIRSGKLIEKKAEMFPMNDDVEEEFFRFIMHFYDLNSNLMPKEIHIPKEFNGEVLDEALPATVKTPLRGAKREMVALTSKNARIAAENKFEMIARDEARTIKVIETLGDLMNIETPRRIE